MMPNTRVLPPAAIEALRVSLATFRKPFDAWQVGWHPDTETFAVYDMDDVRESSFGDRARVIESGFGEVDDAGRFIATRRAESHLRAALPALYEQWAEGRREFRVVGHDGKGEPDDLSPVFETRAEAEAWREENGGFPEDFDPPYERTAVQGRIAAGPWVEGSGDGA